MKKLRPWEAKFLAEITESACSLLDQLPSLRLLLAWSCLLLAAYELEQEARVCLWMGPPRSGALSILSFDVAPVKRSADNLT